MTSDDKRKYTAAQRKDQFIEQLNDLDGVSVGDKLGRSAWDVTTPTGTKAAYFHFNVYFHMWSWSAPTVRSLEAGRDVLHVLLGPRRDQYYVVRDDDFHDPAKFTLYDKKDGGGWVLNAHNQAANTRANARQLQAYRDLTPFTG